MEASVYARLPGAILPWYHANCRALPWRADREPYHVWLSEVMLQQTRAEAVKGYYSRFLAALPDIPALARCDDGALMKLWEGLGYYSRARNLKKAAAIIMERHGGKFPETYREILALPGVGEYTAGAIGSICFALPTPAVDGNVLRVCTRLCADGSPIDTPECKARIREALAQVYPPEAGDFTQGLMELGETICLPNAATKCESCPCRDFCRARAQGNPLDYPVKSPKRARAVEEKTVFILSCGELFALERRPETGLLAALWQFPNVPGTLSAPEAIKLLAARGLHPREIYKTVERRHIFTHLTWQMRGIYAELASPGGGYTWLHAEQIRREVALPTAFRQFWEENGDV
ncbi:MAG: A/G-specific adenine glycosylase [Firmicutes bacterium]|nr:A/G-specific adenine glycosylase [Bacillota bacterium]